MLSKRYTLIISIAIAAVLLVAFAVTLSVGALLATPALTVYGSEEQTVEVFAEYKSAQTKASARFLWMNIDLKVETDGNIDTSRLGSYTVKHTASIFNKRAEITQKVNVVDTTSPEIKTEDQSAIIDFTGYPIDPSIINIKYTATDNFDGDLTDKVQKTIEGDVCWLTVSDSSGNETKKEINLVINDGVRPTILLSGPSTVYVKAGGSYSEAGYSAKDNKDGDLTNKVRVYGDVNYTRSGTYYKYYTVTDEAGNSVKLTRKVIVYGSNNADDYKDVAPNGKTVYLTFDDGPGAYTQKLLGYLDKYNVKATFFVTNQFPKYQHLIKTAYDKGHKIAVHTCSHQIYSKNNNIYTSVDAYMRDFNAMQDIIFKQTGAATNIFRFPGGTNNTISRSQCKGIMTALSKQMTDAGYLYFDWNVDSNDSTYKNTQSIISNTIGQISKKKNAVVLMHDIKNYSVEAVPAIIEYCLEKGYSFKVLDETAPIVRFKPVN